jgi:molybdopterin molybdotransferase
MKPGKPFGFGIIDKTPVFMLSGYPVAVAVQFDMFVRNFILKLQNIHKTINTITAIAGENVRSSPDQYNVIRADFKENDGVVYPIQTKAGINKSILMSNCYIIAEECVGKIKKGDECRILKYSSLKVC